MKILVGTLFSGEPQLQACIASVQAQQGVVADHFILAGLSEPAAHRALYSRFSRDRTADYFVKLDADMVLADNAALATMIGLAIERPTVSDLEVAVRDFFIDHPIAGCHVFREGAIAPEQTLDPVFPDGLRCHGDYDYFVPERDLVLHCPNPSDFQCFNYGYRRGVKTRSAIDRGITARSTAKLAQLRLILIRYQLHEDPRVGLALLGFAFGYSTHSVRGSIGEGISRSFAAESFRTVRRDAVALLDAIGMVSELVRRADAP